MALLATANAGRDLASARDLLQSAGIESVASVVAQQPVVPQMVSSPCGVRFAAVAEQSRARASSVKPGAAAVLRP